MKSDSLGRVITFYTIAIVVSIVLMVLWVVFIINSYQTIDDLGARLGIQTAGYHWAFLSIGCALLVTLIVFLSLQLASSISRILSIRKQDEFVANMTHELKSPIAAIKLHSQTLKQADLSKEESQQFLQFISHQADRLSRLVDQGLEINRLRSGTQNFELTPISVNETLAPLMEEFEKRMQTEGYEFVQEWEDSLKTIGNPMALQRVIDNLLTNAIHATNPPGKIGVKGFATKDHIFLTVWDEGAGIPKHEMRKIFKRFYQIGSEIRGGRRGTGLGLAIVKGLVKEMNGKIKVDSKAGVGSEFILTFPRHMA